MFRIIPSKLGLRTAGLRFMSTHIGSISPLTSTLPISMVRTSLNKSITKPNMSLMQLPIMKDVFKPVPTLGEMEKLREIKEQQNEESESPMQLDSVMRKRRYKIKKHKFRKRRKAQRALRRKLKK